MKKQMIQKLLTTILTISSCTVLICGTGVFTFTANDDNNTNIGITIPDIIEDNIPDYSPLDDDDPFDNDTE